MRTVVISGASSGIGQATARRFAAGGDYVVNLDIRAPAEECQPPVAWQEADVSDWRRVGDIVDRVRAETGRLDVVIANAGISIRRGVLDLTEAQARRITEVNLLGVLGLWQCAARHMMRDGGGVLLATASVNGLRGYPFYADYNATKAGIVALCRTFALELAPQVRVCCVSPGAVLTPMQLAEYTGQMLDEVNEAIPAGRHAAPREIAEAFWYLAGQHAGFLTGLELVIDGGETAGATTSAFGTGGLSKA
ncbi:MAG TPA: SDR family oxidoreductase [Streptosporangiaceae bacterium]|nr:SDR family oxidoreductase [Streptosporangiaceae bacterium]